MEFIALASVVVAAILGGAGASLALVEVMDRIWGP